MLTKIEVEILEDGTISITTGDIAETQHLSADELLSEIANLAGGVVKKEKRENPFWKNRNVLRGGKVVKVGGGQ